MSWHYKYIETIEYADKNNPRNGEYLAYESEVFDKLLHDKDWRHKNDAFDEWDYVTDACIYMLETNDEKIIFIPTASVYSKIESYYDCELYEDFV